jgi:hypothetical protein
LTSPPPRRGTSPRVWLALGFTPLLSCVPEFDTARQPRPERTLGAEIFHVACARVHAGERPSDVSFSLGRRPCAEGLNPDEGAPGAGPKVNALGHLRAESVAALDLALPEPLHDRLDGLLLDLLPLYGPDGAGRTTPDGGVGVLLPDGGVTPGDDLLPRTTRSVSSLLGTMATDVGLLNALGRASLRQGYRHPSVAIGLLRPVLAHPRVDAVLDDTLRLLREGRPGAPEGAAHRDFNTLLATLRGEMLNAGPSTASTGGTTLDATLDLAFRSEAALGTGQTLPVVRRDVRGLAVVNAVNGAMPPPFADADRDGLADARGGAFVRGDTPVEAPSPFPARFTPAATRDPLGRALGPGGAPLYRYADLDSTLLAALARQLPPLLGGPTHETVPALQLLHGASLFLGQRRDATRAYPGASEVAYRQYTAERAPLVDLVHAVGVLLSHRDAPQVLATLAQLTAGERETVTARLLGAVLAVDAIADRYPNVGLDARSTVWDDVMDVVRRIAEEPGLLEDILEATARLREPIAAQGAWQPRCAGSIPADNLSRAFSAYARNRDRVQPDWTASPNTPVDVTLQRPVDRARPDTVNLASPGAADDNRAVLARLFHLVDDLNGAEICNRDSATVRLFPRAYGIPLGPVSVPGIPRYDRCRLLRVPDAAAFFVRSVAGGNRAVLAVDLGGFLDTLTDAARRFNIPIDRTLDGLIERQSGITGLTSLPSPFAIARLVFQPNPSEFISDITHPIAVRNSEGYVSATASAEDRRRYEVARAHPGTIFVWESYCFYDSIRPLAIAFARHDRLGTRLDPALSPGADPQTVAPANVDTSRGSKLFSDLLSAFHRHWPTTRAGGYQSRTRCERCREGVGYSQQDGAQAYEPIVSQALEGDLLQSLAAATTELRAIQLSSGRRGLDAFAALVRALVDPNARGMDGQAGFPMAPAYRDGATSTLWSDNSTPTRATVFTLFADAFNAMDPLLAADPMRRASWESARGALVDQVLTVDGTGTAARFRNPATGAMTRQLIAWLRDRLEAHRVAGDLTPWARGLSGRLAETVRGPAMASGLDLTLALYNDRDARARTAELLAALLDPRRPDADTASGFATTLSAAADILQLMRADGEVDPILRAAAPAMVPDTGTVAQSLRFLDRAREVDTTRVLTEALGNLVRRPLSLRDTPTAAPIPVEPLTVIADAIADTHRERPAGRPGTRGPLTRQDAFVLLRNLVEFLSDRSRGMEQFYYIVQHRRLPQ